MEEFLLPFFSRSTIKIRSRSSCLIVKTKGNQRENAMKLEESEKQKMLVESFVALNLKASPYILSNETTKNSLFNCVFMFSASMWRMAPLLAAAPWTLRPPLAPVWSSTPTSQDTTSAESPSSIAQTATMNCPPSPCHETPPSPLNCE